MRSLKPEESSEIISKVKLTLIPENIPVKVKDPENNKRGIRSMENNGIGAMSRVHWFVVISLYMGLVLVLSKQG